MTQDKRLRAQSALCGELRDDDGVDPREFHQRTEGGSKPSGRGRKTRQLCTQVAEALGQILASEFDDDRLLGFSVITVEPAPNPSQLLVTLLYGGPPADRDELLAVLERVSGFLRSEVAACITRKRVPRLQFRIV